MFSSLSDALKQTGFSDAMAKLGLNSGPGSDGTLPSSSRLLRSEGAGCTKLLGNWIAFNNSADLGVPGKVFQEIQLKLQSASFIGSDGELDESKITEAIALLNTINTRLEKKFDEYKFVIVHIGFISPTLESDIGSCTKETSRSNLAIVQIRYYSMFLAIKHFIYDNFL